MVELTGGSSAALRGKFDWPGQLTIGVGRNLHDKESASMIWRDWNRVERISLVGIIVGLLAAVAAWLVVPEIRTIIGRANETKSGPIAPGLSPHNTTTAPWISPTKPIVTLSEPGTEEELRANIRLSHQVRRLDVIENELRFSNAPRGVYGFVSQTNLILIETIGITLRREGDFSNSFEIHKLSDGTAELIGFLAQDTASRLSRDNRSPGLQITLYSSKWEGAPSIVSIPMGLLNQDFDPRTIHLNNESSILAIDITVK